MQEQKHFRQCQLICQECQRIHDYCSKNEPQFVKQFSGEVVSTAADR